MDFTADIIISSDFGRAAPFDISNHNDKIDRVATATGRLGYAWDKWLFFGKGGWAWAGFSGSTDQTNEAGTIGTATSISQETRDGWTAGGGLEYAVTPNILIKLEGDYVKFNTANFNATTTAPDKAFICSGKDAHLHSAPGELPPSTKT